MPQDIKTGSVYNTQIPLLSDTADIVVALTNYHYGITTGIAPVDGSVTAGIAGLFKSKAPLASPAFTGTISLAQATGIYTGVHTITPTELGYLNGVASNVQIQINNLKTNPVFDGIVFKDQPVPPVISTTTTLTWAQIKNLIIMSYPSATIEFTLPAATSSAITTNGYSFDWSIINKHPSKSVQIKPNTTVNATHTYDGAITVLYNTSARFTSKRVSATSYETYRIA